jgi:opacity protein-like surface antigen
MTFQSLPKRDRILALRLAVPSKIEGDVFMRKRLLCLLIPCLLWAMPALAQEQPVAEPPAIEQAAPQEPVTEEPAVEKPAAEEQKWTTTLTPVVWLATTTTDVSIGDRSRSVTLRAADALSSFEGGGSARLEANNGQWGGFADLFFISLGNEANVGPLGNIPISLGVDNLLWQVAGTYRVVNKEDFNLDILAGARGYSIDVDVTIEPFTGPAGVLRFPGRFASAGLSFTDPIIGAKAAWKLSDRWDLDLYGDVGGFGAGSDFTYRLGAGLGYSVSQSVSLRGGYTLIDFNYSRGSGFDEVEYDTTMYGPTLGASFKF